jgi:phosphonate transport system permease protein
VVGLVGASGLGSQLLESLSAFAWERILALVAVYASLTLLGEELADRLRRRLLTRANPVAADKGPMPADPSPPAPFPAP